MKSKIQLAHLLTVYGSKRVEKHLLYSYIQSKKIDYKSNKILKKYFRGIIVNEQLLKIIDSFKISSIKDLEKCLELIIPYEDRKLNGAFFTPDYIIDFITKELQPTFEAKNLDPSCGCGAFLIGLTEYYQRTFNKSIRSTVKENIFGSDILDYNILRTKLLLTIFALQNNEQLEERDFNLYHQDSLNAKWKMKFDNIVGNPPYVKFQDLSEEMRLTLPNKWETIKGGTFNLYFAFFELGYQLLSKGGSLGFITPNSYFTSLSGESLRVYLQKHKCVRRIIDFSDKKVFDALTYTALTFVTKKNQNEILYDRIKDHLSPEEFLPLANGSPNSTKNLNSKKWRLLKKDERKIIETIETNGTPLSQLFDIRAGIATLKDELYFLDSNFIDGDFLLKNVNDKIYRIEKEITRPIYKISDFRTQEEISENTRRVIFPYETVNGVVQPIPEKEFRKKYPFCFKYFLSVKSQLLKRDKGKVKFDPFYMWGRSQGISSNGIKLLNPTFSQFPRFLLVEEIDSFYSNGYGLFFKDTVNKNPISESKNIDVLQKILNSRIMDYYVRHTSVRIDGGYPCYQKNFIESFTIPNLSDDQIKKIRSLRNKKSIDKELEKIYQFNLPVPNLLS